MKKTIIRCGLVASAAIMTLGTGSAAERKEQVVTVTADTSGANSTADAEKGQKRIVVKRVESGGEKEKMVDLPWLGVATEEPSEALAAQLGLRRGEGLLVSYLAPDGPAAKAGLQKNDVIFKLDDQILLLPTQLRKLVRLHKEGDKVQLGYYRAGKKDQLSATLGKTTGPANLLGEDEASSSDLKKLHILLRESLDGSGLEGLKNIHVLSSAHGLDRQAVNFEIKREVESARAAVEKALRQTANSHRLPDAATREIEEITRSGVDVGKDASVTIRRQSREAKTSVTTDESGTYVIVANPKKRLTVHDKDGKLLFDGEIETHDQQEKVPREIWEKVQQMIEKMKHAKVEEMDSESTPGQGAQSTTELEPIAPSNG